MFIVLIIGAFFIIPALFFDTGFYQEHLKDFYDNVGLRNEPGDDSSAGANDGSGQSGGSSGGAGSSGPVSGGAGGTVSGGGGSSFYYNDSATGTPVYCSDESRLVEECDPYYQNSVCGWYDPNVMTCSGEVCVKGFVNECFACLEERVLYWTAGECPLHDYVIE